VEAAEGMEAWVKKERDDRQTKEDREAQRRERMKEAKMRAEAAAAAAAVYYGRFADAHLQPPGMAPPMSTTTASLSTLQESTPTEENPLEITPLPAAEDGPLIREQTAINEPLTNGITKGALPNPSPSPGAPL